MDDFKSFQDLAQRMAEALQIQQHEVTEPHHKLVDILHSYTSARMVLPVNKALLDPARIIWQTPASVLPTCRWADKKYFVPAKSIEFSFSHPLPNSIIVDAVKSRYHQYQHRSTPYDQDGKCSDPVWQKNVFVSHPSVLGSKLSGLVGQI